MDGTGLFSSSHKQRIGRVRHFGLGFVVLGFSSLSLIIINHNHSRIDLPGWLDILAPPWGGVFLAVVLPTPVLTRLFHKQPLGPAWLGLTFSVQSIIVGSENIKH